MVPTFVHSILLFKFLLVFFLSFFFLSVSFHSSRVCPFCGQNHFPFNCEWPVVFVLGLSQKPHLYIADLLFYFLLVIPLWELPLQLQSSSFVCTIQWPCLRSVHYLWPGGGGGGGFDKINRRKKIAPPPHDTVGKSPPPPSSCFKNMPLCCYGAPATVTIHVMSLS